MDRCLLDTSALSDVILPANRRLPVVARKLAGYLRSHRRLTFSEVSCYEVLRGLRKKMAATQEQQFLQFCTRCELVPINYDVLDRAASLWAAGRRQGIVIDDGDLLIASTALQHNLPLVTANSKHFNWISGLRLLNWRE